MNSLLQNNPDASQLQEDIYWLAGLKYFGEKKAVITEFLHGSLKRSFVFPFFPSFIVSKKAVSKEGLKEEIALLGKQKFELRETGNCLRVFSSNFSMLQMLANNIFASNNVAAIMPPPERQFLLEKQWGFFDAFKMPSEKTIPGNLAPVREDSMEFSLPDITTDFFSDSFEATIRGLAKIDSKEADSILSLVSVSKILCVPLEDIPAAGFLRQEVFLENILFRSNFAPEQLARPSRNEAHTTQSASFFRGNPEFDVMPVMPLLLTDKVFNFGFETIDCSCCPSESNGNLLPNSLAKVEFLKDAFYFDSISSSFADSFHEKHSFRENRLRRKKEFFLKKFPTGPFNRHETTDVPLQDAFLLEKNNEAKILGFNETHWFCKKRESFLSEAIKKLQLEIHESCVSIEKSEQDCFSNSIGLQSLFLLENNFSIRFTAEHKKNLEFFLNNLPAHLCNHESRFFNKKLAEAIIAVQAGAVYAYDSLRQKNNPLEIASCLVAISKAGASPCPKV